MTVLMSMFDRRTRSVVTRGFDSLDNAVAEMERAGVEYDVLLDFSGKTEVAEG